MKKTKTALAILFLASPLSAFAQNSTTGAQGWNLSSVSGFGLPSGSIINIVTNILDWLLMLLGIFGIIGFVISGIIYLISTGDETMVERAKMAMKWSIVGIIVGLMGFVIIQAVDTALMGSTFF